LEIDVARYPVDIKVEDVSDQLRKLTSAGNPSTPYPVNMHTQNQGPLGFGAPAENPRPVVCVIDSGYLMGHEDLPDSSRVTADPNPDPNNSDVFVDGCGHGTHVAGTIGAISSNDFGVNSIAGGGEIKMHIIKVFRNDCQWTYASDLIGAVDRCMDAGAKVISMSLGGGAPSSSEEQAFNEARDAGVINIAAAGNSGSSGYSYPASYDSIVSVAAIDSNKNKASFSTFNDKVEIAAGGVNVLSTYNNAGTNGYASLSGTSMATPNVASCAAALFLYFPDATGEEVRTAMTSTAEDLGSPGRDDETGFGSLDCVAAMGYLEDCNRATPTAAFNVPQLSSCDAGIPIDFSMTNNDEGCSSPRQASFKLSNFVSDSDSVEYAFQSGSTSSSGSASFEVSVLTDNYPGETSWQMTNAAGEILFQGGGLANRRTPYEFSYDDVPVSVGDNVNTFTVFDSYGDGVCCSFGEGFVELKRVLPDGSRSVLFTANSFGSQVSESIAITGAASGATSEKFNVNAGATVSNTLDVTFPNGGPSGDVTFDLAVLSGDDTLLTESIVMSCSGPATPPDAPTGVTVSSVTASGFVVSWTDVSNEDEYNLFVCPFTAGSDCTEQNSKTAKVPANGESYTFTGLVPNTEYKVQVEAENTAGKSARTSATLTTLEECVEAAPSVATLSGSSLEVDCANGGEYDVTLRVSNNNLGPCDAESLSTAAIISSTSASRISGSLAGGDTFGSPSSVEVTVSILTDNYPRETTAYLWVAGDESSRVDLGPFNERQFLYEQSVSLDSSRQWELKVLDSWGDGICCSYGRGEITMTSSAFAVDPVVVDASFGQESVTQLELTPGTGETGAYSPARGLSSAEFFDIVYSITVSAGDSASGPFDVSLGVYEGSFSVGATAAGSSSLSLVCGEVEPPQPPAAPVLLSVSTGATDPRTTADVAWSAVEGVTAYRVVAVQGSITVMEDMSGTSGTLVGLQPGTTYTVSVKAVSSDGLESSASNAIDVTTNPAIPSSLDSLDAAYDSSSDTVTLSWVYPVDGATVDRYEVERATSTGWESVADVASSAVSFVDDGQSFAPETTYSYRVRAVNFVSPGPAQPGSWTTAEVTTPAVCVFANPIVSVAASNPSSDIPCGKQRVYDVTVQVESKHHPVCGTVEHVVSAADLPGEYGFCDEFTLSVVSDDWPSEFHWRAADSDTDAQLYVGAGSGTHTMTLCPSSGVVKFEFFDAGGDGLLGEGGFTITRGGTTEVDTLGGGFSSGYESHSVSIPSPFGSVSLEGSSSVTLAPVSIGTSGSDAATVAVDVTSSGSTSTTSSVALDAACA